MLPRTRTWKRVMGLLWKHSWKFLDHFMSKLFVCLVGLSQESKICGLVYNTHPRKVGWRGVRVLTFALFYGSSISTQYFSHPTFPLEPSKCWHVRGEKIFNANVFRNLFRSAQRNVEPAPCTEKFGVNNCWPWARSPTNPKMNVLDPDLSPRRPATIELVPVMTTNHPDTSSTATITTTTMILDPWRRTFCPPSRPISTKPLSKNRGKRRWNWRSADMRPFTREPKSKLHVLSKSSTSEFVRSAWHLTCFNCQKPPTPLGTKCWHKMKSYLSSSSGKQ